MKMKKSDISLRGKIQHQKDVGYNLMDKYLGVLAGLADVKPEVNTSDYAELLREAAKQIKRPLSDYGRDLIQRLEKAAKELEGANNDN